MAILVLAIAGVLLATRGREPPAPSPTELGDEVAVAGRPVLQGPPGVEADSSRSAGPAGVTSRGDEGPPPRDPGEVLVLSGSVRVATNDGRELDDVTGIVSLEVEGARGSSHIDVQAVRGAWAAKVPSGYVTRPRCLTWEGRLATFPADAAVLAEARANGLVLLAREVPASSLRVVDAATGHDLDDVRVIRPQDGFLHDLEHPLPASKGDWTIAGVRSPVTLPAPPDPHAQAAVVFYVGSPGHAWVRILVDMQVGGERLVRLEPGGELVVTLTGAELPEDGTLRVRGVARRDDAPLAEQPLGGKRVVALWGLPAGPARVSVEQGPWYDAPKVLAAAATEVQAWASANLTLDLPPWSRNEPVALAGEVHLDPGWKGLEPTLTVKREEPSHPEDSRWRHLRPGHGLEPVDPEHLVWRFDAGLIIPGRHALVLDALQIRRMLQVGTQGAPSVRIDVPPPGIVQVKVDLPDGHATEATSVTWHGVLPEGLGGYSPAVARPDPASGLHAIRAPHGPIVISASDWLLKAEHIRVEVGRNPQTVTLTARRRSHVVVRVQDGTARVPWSEAWDVDLRNHEGGSMVTGFGIEEDDGGCLLAVDEPGEYRLVVGSIPGFEAIPEQRVTLGPLAPTVVVLRLERLR